MNPADASSQTANAIDLAVPWITTGANSLRITGGFRNDSGSFLGLTDSLVNLMGHGETSHVTAEVGVRLRRIELGVRGRPTPRRRLEFGVDVFGQSFRYSQLRESSILSFTRNIPTFDVLNYVYPEDPISYVRSGYGARVFAEMPSPSGKSRLGFTYEFDVSAYRPTTDGTDSWFRQLNFRGRNAPDSLTGIQTGKLGISYLRNTVDDRIQPKRGTMFRMSFSVAGLGGNVDFLEPDIEARYYRRGFASRHVLALNFRGRMIAGYNGKAAPPVERFYMGGEDELRGFDSGSVGPIGLVPGAKAVDVLNPDGSTRTQKVLVNNMLISVPVTILSPYYRYTNTGGDTKLTGNAEYRVPLFGPMTLVLFDDAGVNRTTFVHQLHLNDEPLLAEFPAFGSDANRMIPARGIRNLRMSVGAELEVLAPKVKIPIRFFWAWNPLAYRDYLPFPPVVVDRSEFPNNPTFIEALESTATSPYYREPRSRLQVSIGRTF